MPDSEQAGIHTAASVMKQPPYSFHGVITYESYEVGKLARKMVHQLG